MSTMPWVSAANSGSMEMASAMLVSGPGGVDGDLVRMRVHLADEEVHGVFVDGLDGRHAFGQRRNVVWPVRLQSVGVTGVTPFAFSTSMVGPWPHAPSQVTLPSIADSRSRFALVRTSGKTAPLATGTSAWPVSSSMRRVCSVSSSHQALPVTMVMPRTSRAGDCSSDEHRHLVGAAGTGAVLVDEDEAFLRDTRGRCESKDKQGVCDSHCGYCGIHAGGDELRLSAAESLAAEPAP